MTPLKTIDAFTGILTGTGFSAKCTVMATKVTEPTTGQFTYTNYSIHSVSQELPDGLYELEVNGEKLSVRKYGERWLAGSPI
jgi:hypothetical protein